MPVGFAAAAIGVVSSVAGGIAQSNSDAYKAKIAQLNSQISEQNADYAEQAGTVQAFNQSLKNRGAAGRLKANQAASGVDVNTGSAVAVQKSQREVGETDVQQIVSNANREAYGYRSQAAGFQGQQQLDQTASSNDLASGILSGVGKGLSSFAGGDAPTWLFSDSSSGGGDPAYTMGPSGFPVGPH